jgi:hypothetical protein
LCAKGVVQRKFSYFPAPAPSGSASPMLANHSATRADHASKGFARSGSGIVHLSPAVVGCASCGYRQACSEWLGSTKSRRLNPEEERSGIPTTFLRLWEIVVRADLDSQGLITSHALVPDQASSTCRAAPNP